MKLLKNVLIKLTKGGYVDRVMFLDNVPEDYFYHMAHPRVCVGQGQQQHWEADSSKEKIPTLHEELRLSQTGDGGIVFDMDNEQALSRWATLHRHIVASFPYGQKITEPAPYAMDPSDPRSMPLPQERIPRAVLPVLSPPTGVQANPSEVTQVAGTKETALTLDVEAIKAQAIAEYQESQKEEARARMAKAREAKAKA